MRDEIFSWDRHPEPILHGDPPEQPTLPPALVALGPYYSIASLEPFHDQGQRYELVDGELLVNWRVSYRHQRLMSGLVPDLGNYLEPVRELESIMQVWVQSGTDTLLLPDLMVMPAHRLRREEPCPLEELLLVVEILDYDSVHTDRFTKRVRYQRAGIGTCWLVDPTREVIDVWTPGATLPVVQRDEVRWRAPGLDSDFVVDVPALFRTP